MDKRFLTAFLQSEKTNISGYKLDPFCFRHLLTLEAINSPFYNYENIKNGEKIPTIEDILIFLKICSNQNWESALKRKTIKDWYIYSKLKYSPVESIIIIQKIIIYMSDSFSVPKTWTKIENEKGNIEIKKNTFHPSSLLITLLMTKFNFSEKDAWNLPIGRAVWYSTCYAKNEGVDLSIIRTEDEEREDSDLIKLKKYEQDALEKYSKIIKQKKVKLL